MCLYLTTSTLALTVHINCIHRLINLLQLAYTILFVDLCEVPLRIQSDSLVIIKQNIED